MDNELKECGGANWLINHGVFSRSKICPGCKKLINLSFKKLAYRCYNKNCRMEISVRNNTIFGKTKLKLEKAIMLLFLYLNRYETKTIEMELKICRKTIAKFKINYRKLLKEILEEQKSYMIGGNRHIVQIDEMCIGHRKYKRGRRVAKESQRWFVVGIDTITKEIFYEEVKDRQMDTLNELIKRRVRMNSIISLSCLFPYREQNVRQSAPQMSVVCET